MPNVSSNALLLILIAFCEWRCKCIFMEQCDALQIGHGSINGCHHVNHLLNFWVNSILTNRIGKPSMWIDNFSEFNHFLLTFNCASLSQSASIFIRCYQAWLSIVFKSRIAPSVNQWTMYWNHLKHMAFRVIEFVHPRAMAISDFIENIIIGYFCRELCISSHGFEPRSNLLSSPLVVQLLLWIICLMICVNTSEFKTHVDNFNHICLNVWSILQLSKLRSWRTAPSSSWDWANICTPLRFKMQTRLLVLANLSLQVNFDGS